VTMFSTEPSVSDSLLEELISYIGFTAEDGALLARSKALLEPSFTGAIDAFYDAIGANPRARAVFEDEVQIERQKRVLRDWLETLFSGVYDRDYFDARARIGYAHVRIGLDPSLMVAAMNILRESLHAAVNRHMDAADWEPHEIVALHSAINRICDIDLAIMLETYSEDYTSRMRGAERLAALGQVAGTIGHELRNPLAVMETSVHLLRSRVAGDEKGERHLRRLADQIALSSRIIREILALARDVPPETEKVRVLGILESVVGEMEGGGEIRVHASIAEDYEFELDPGQLRQLFTNLLTNAIQASPRGAAGVEISIEEHTDGLAIIVEDDGPGVPNHLRSKIFEPLFTTRMRGVGFGLALCRRIVESHGGHIRVVDRVGGGARFEVLLLRRAEVTP